MRNPKSVFFTSDTHFGHENILNYQASTRGQFKNSKEMDDHMVFLWNSMVKPGDTIFHTVDFGWTDSVGHRLNGYKVLIPGNHDRKGLSRAAFRSQFNEIADPIHEINIEGQVVVLSHFPIWEWNRIHYGTFHLHGHVHGKPTGVPGRIMDIGVDANSSLRPFTWSEIRDKLLPKEIRNHH